MVLFIPNKHLSLKCQCHTIVHQTVIVWEGRESSIEVFLTQSKGFLTSGKVATTVNVPGNVCVTSKTPTFDFHRCRVVLLQAPLSHKEALSDNILSYTRLKMSLSRIVGYFLGKENWVDTLIA